MAHQALAELAFTVEASRKGVRIPQSEIKMVPFEFGRSRIGHGGIGPPPRPPGQVIQDAASQPHGHQRQLVRPVNTTPSTNTIKVIHGAFQHPSRSPRPA